jgi:hypothetical protein
VKEQEKQIDENQSEGTLTAERKWNEWVRRNGRERVGVKKVMFVF